MQLDRLSLAAALLLGADLPTTHLLVLRADPWRTQSADAIARLVALRELLRLDADFEKHVVDLGGAELAAFFELLDKQPEQLAATVLDVRSLPAGHLVRECVKDPSAGLVAQIAVRALAQKLISIHGRSPVGGLLE